MLTFLLLISYCPSIIQNTLQIILPEYWFLLRTSTDFMVILLNLLIYNQLWHHLVNIISLTCPVKNYRVWSAIIILITVWGMFVEVEYISQKAIFDMGWWCKFNTTKFPMSHLCGSMSVIPQGREDKYHQFIYKIKILSRYLIW